MSDTTQLRQAVAMLLDIMPTVPIFSASQVNDLINELENVSRATGALHCPTCGFHASLNFHSTSVETCPNECGPLSPLTWKQHAEKLEARIVEIETELTAAAAKRRGDS